MAEIDIDNLAPKKRYLALKEPEHGCCFEAVILDTHVRTIHNPEGRRVCEVVTYSEARKIEALLNG